MDLYRVLVVDDEAFITNSVVALLQCQQDWNIDVSSANSVKDALDIMHAKRIDILITDICMPGENGLDLVACTKALWPSCYTLILTAYNDFNYAYRAIQLGSDDFVLKLETDEYLLSSIQRAINAVEEQQKKISALPPSEAERININSELLRSISLIRRSQEDCRSVLQMMGFSNDTTHLHLIVCTSERPLPEFYSLINLCSRFLRPDGKLLAACPDGNNILMLFGMPTPAPIIMDSLEPVQTAVHTQLGANASFIIAPDIEEHCDAFTEYQRIKDFLNALPNRSYTFVHTLRQTEVSPEMQDQDYPLSAILDYINQHIYSTEISLDAISHTIGYSGSYLSKLFYDKTGQRISKYIAERRLSLIKEMMKDPQLSLTEIAERCGFSSRSYFNRYVRRLSGYSPKSLRAQLLAEPRE